MSAFPSLLPCCLRPSRGDIGACDGTIMWQAICIALHRMQDLLPTDCSSRDYKKFTEDARAHILYGSPKPASGAGLPARGTWGNHSGGDLAALDANPVAKPVGAAAGSANGGGAAAGDAHAKSNPGQGREEGEDGAAPAPAPAAEALPRQATADAAEFLTAKSEPQPSMCVISRALLWSMQLCMRSMPMPSLPRAFVGSLSTAWRSLIVASPGQAYYIVEAGFA